jgi:hypothetical protein
MKNYVLQVKRIKPVGPAIVRKQILDTLGNADAKSRKYLDDNHPKHKVERFMFKDSYVYHLHNEQKELEFVAVLSLSKPEL